MALRPTKLPLWAAVNEIDPVTGNANKVEPPLQWKNSGVKYRQPVPRQYLNYNQDLICDWIEYLDKQVSAPTPIPNILDAVYPVGSVYYSTVTANPATYGFPGTWNAIGQGRCITGLNTGDSDFNTIKKTGGSKTHNHGGVTGGTTLGPANIPAHTHDYYLYVGGAFERNGGASAAVVNGVTARNNGTVDTTASGNTVASTFQTSSVGNTMPHDHTVSSASNLQPYITLAIWERVS